MCCASVSARNGDSLSTTSPIASLTTSSKRDMCAPFCSRAEIDEALQAREEQLLADAHDLLHFLITTNHKTDGIYLPSDDRRHYVAWSDFIKEDFSREFWDRIWSWYAGGGMSHVAAYLATHDISGFNPKAPPPKRPAFWEIVSTNQAPEDSELADVIDVIGKPAALTVKQLIAAAKGATAEWLSERKNRRALPHRLERCGYVSVRNPEAKDGIWKIARYTPVDLRAGGPTDSEADRGSSKALK